MSRDRDRYYCHAHHNELLERRKKRDAIRLLELTLKSTYDRLLKARRELHKRGIKDPTVVELDLEQKTLDAGHRAMK